MKTPYHKFRTKMILYGVISFLILILSIVKLDKFFFVSSLVFAVISFFYYLVAQKHKNDSPYLISFLFHKIKEKINTEESIDENGNTIRVPKKSKKQVMKENKEKYHNFVKQIEKDFDFDYSDQKDEDFDDENDLEDDSDEFEEE